MKRWAFAFLVLGCSGNGAAPPADGDSATPPPIVPATHTLYLNFEGITVAAGATDDATQNISSLVTAPTTLPPYLGSAADRAAQIAAIAAEVADILAPYQIEVMTTRPTTGTFMMVVTTDASSDALSCSNCPALGDDDCGTVDSPIGFNFGAGGAAAPVHGLTADTVAMLGIAVGGIPTSAVPDDCMCFTDDNCQYPPDRQCTIGGIGTAVSDMKPICLATGSVMDEAGLFLDRWGPH